MTYAYEKQAVYFIIEVDFLSSFDGKVRDENGEG